MTDLMRAVVLDAPGPRVTVPVHRVFDFDEIREAHRYMEAGMASGKLVVTT